MTDRVLTVGIDGGEMSLINKWIDEGELPNIKKIKENGASGPLRSTIPPITGAAWSSFQTGTNPGKHGAFNWFKRSEGEYNAEPVTALDIQEPTLWRILNKFKKKVGLIGVPVTTPPEQVENFMVPGLLTTKNAQTQSYPEDFINHVKEIVPDFKFSPKEWTRGYSVEDWVDEMVEDIEKKTKLTKQLMMEQDWHYFMVHFMETDQVQHYLWHELEQPPYHIKRIYKAIDRAIGELKEFLDEEDTLLIMSDHGFGDLKYNFHIDTWLLKEGYITLKKNFITQFKKLFFKLGFTKEALLPIGEYIYPPLRKLGIVETAVDLASNPMLDWLFISSNNVNWKKSLAYSHSEIGHIFLNIKGRDPEGVLEPAEAEQVREELIEKLRNFENPFTGKKITTEIYKGEEIYHGNMAENAPDIVFIPDDMSVLGKGAYQFLSNKKVSESQNQTGHHRMDGIFFAEGPDIQKGSKVSGAHIMDIAPTVLYLLDLPILNSMDGKILRDVIKENFSENIDEMYVDKADIGLEKNLRDNLFKNDIQDKKDRLKGLGYVS
ncbi:MAG TPA: alkaline phosphatase family protein [Halanaerobiales bacterium]|nr:alkaline phosphatase family protein [Halanaerobiales bacterium]